MGNAKANATDFQKEVKPPSIGHELSVLTNAITCLSRTLPLTMNALQIAVNKAQHQFREFEKENLIEQGKDGKKILILKADAFIQFDKLLKDLRTYTSASKIVSRSFLVSLVSQYDAFVGALLKALFLIRPELLNASEKTLTLSQLLDVSVNLKCPIYRRVKCRTYDRRDAPIIVVRDGSKMIV